MSHCPGCHPHPCECDPATRRAWATFDEVALAEREARTEAPPQLATWRCREDSWEGYRYHGPSLEPPTGDPAVPALYDPPWEG